MKDKINVLHFYIIHVKHFIHFYNQSAIFSAILIDAIIYWSWEWFDVFSINKITKITS